MDKLIKLFFVLGVCTFCNGQNRVVVLKTNLLNYPLYSASVYTEIGQSERKSDVFSLVIGDREKKSERRKDIFASFSYSKRFYRPYPTELSGYYLAPYVKYLYKEYLQPEANFIFVPIAESQDYQRHSLAIGCDIGFQYLIKNRVAVDVIGGLGTGYTVYAKGYGFSDFHLDGKFGVLVGYKFKNKNGKNS